MVSEITMSELVALEGCRFSFSGYSFDDAGAKFVIDCYDGSSTLRRVFRPLGERFVFRRVRRRQCTGWYDILTSKSQPCPNSTQVDIHANSSQCNNCFGVTGFNPFFYNVPKAEISKKQYEYNMQPHVVYLAYFGGGVVKAGISNANRIRVRLLEQGAWAACIFSHFKNAWDARSLETELCKRREILETIRGEKKRNLLSGFAAIDCNISYLTDVTSSVASDLRLSNPVKVVDLREYYGDFNAAFDASDASAAQPYVISGDVKALVGPTLVAEHQVGSILFSMSKLVSFGFTVEKGVCVVETRPAQRRLL